MAADARAGTPRLPSAVVLWSAAGVAAGGAISVVSLNSSPTTAAGPWFAALGGLLTAAGLLGLGQSRHGWRQTLSSPLLVVVLMLALLFVWRPAGLITDPRSTTQGLVNIGYSWEDLTRAVAIGTLGFGLFGLAFLVGWGGRRGRREPRGGVVLPDDRRLVAGIVGALVVGTALWGANFQSSGGFSALIDDPASLHLEQFGTAYASFGFALCLAAALAALWALLARPSRALRLALAGASTVSIVAAICLQTRGPLVATIVAAGLVLIAWRSFDWRRTLAALGIVLLLAYGLFFIRTVRDYSQTQPFGIAVESALTTNPLSLPRGDILETDHLVALDRLVPEVLPSLSGQTIKNVPGTFVPRQLWKGKPYPIDLRLARKLYGSSTRAGTPFTLVGELMWNFGLGWAFVGMGVAGLVAGLGWRALWPRATGPLLMVAATVTGYAYLVLSRPLGPMLLTMSLGLVAVLFALTLMGLWDPVATARRWLAGLRGASPGALRARRAAPPRERVPDS